MSKTQTELSPEHTWTNPDHKPISSKYLNPTFVKASVDERVIIRRIMSVYEVPESDYEETPVYCGASYEVKFHFANRLFVGELKVREIGSNDFNSGLIEKVKYLRLLEAGRRLKAEPIYIMHYPDDTIRIWGLKKVIEPTWSYKWLPGDGVNKTNYKWKLAGEIPNENGLYIQLPPIE